MYTNDDDGVQLKPIYIRINDKKKKKKKLKYNTRVLIVQIKN